MNGATPHPWDEMADTRSVVTSWVPVWPTRAMGHAGGAFSTILQILRSVRQTVNFGDRSDAGWLPPTDLISPESRHS